MAVRHIGDRLDHLCACAVLSVNRPGLDKTTKALRPQHGEAEQALEEVTASLGISQDSTWIIVSGSHEREVYQRLSQAEAILNQALSNQVISGYLLPTALWPRVEFQDANRGTARFLGTQGPLLREAALREGFNTNALFLTDELVRTWARAGARSGVDLADQPGEPMAAETVYGPHHQRVAGDGVGLSRHQSA